MRVVLWRRLAPDLSTIHAFPTSFAEGLTDYDREIGDDEIVDGKRVADWPVGMHVVSTLPRLASS